MLIEKQSAPCISKDYPAQLDNRGHNWIIVDYQKDLTRPLTQHKGTLDLLDLLVMLDCPLGFPSMVHLWLVKFPQGFSNYLNAENHHFLQTQFQIFLLILFKICAYNSALLLIWLCFYPLVIYPFQNQNLLRRGAISGTLAPCTPTCVYV